MDKFHIEFYKWGKDYKIFNDTLMYKEWGTLYQKYKKIPINDILIKNNKNEFEAE